MSTRSSDSENPALSANIRIRSGMELPPLPRTVVEVSGIMLSSGEEHDVQRLAEVVRGDPVVAASVLRRINSAYYGIRRHISTVRKAVVLLGFVEVADLVMTAGTLTLEELFEDDDQTSFFRQIMRASIEAAQYGQEIARFLDLPVKGAACSAGLLHATGRLVFLYNQPYEYAALWHADEGAALPSLEGEEMIFGTNHAELGAQAAEAWHLPEVLVQALRHYPSPAQVETHRPVAAILGAACLAVNTFSDEQAEGRRGAALAASSPFKMLAERAETSPRALAKAVERHRPEVEEYVRLMMGSPSE